MNQAVFEKIVKLLDEKKISYQLFEHEPVYTCEQAAKLRDTKIEQGAKALVMMADKKSILVVISAAKRVDSKKFKKIFGIKDLRMCTPEEVEAITETKIGAVPPLGGVMGLPTYIDRSLGKNEEISFNAGLHTKSVKMKYQDYYLMVQPQLGDFAQ